MSLGYPCVYHENGKCKKFSDDEAISFCVFGPCKYETPSNADRIRAMSDEAMAEKLQYASGCPVNADCIKMSGDCKACWLDWLRQPAEEET